MNISEMASLITYVGVIFGCCSILRHGGVSSLIHTWNISLTSPICLDISTMPWSRSSISASLNVMALSSAAD